jgi:hypothetical protein
MRVWCARHPVFATTVQAREIARMSTPRVLTHPGPPRRALAALLTDARQAVAVRPALWLVRAACCLSLGLLLPGCRSVSLLPQLPPELAAAQPLEVSGRHGWQADRQALRFGAYATSPRQKQLQTLRQGCAAGCQAFNLSQFGASVATRLETAQRHLRFTQSGPDAAPLAVQAFQSRDSETRDWAWSAFGKRISGSEGTRTEHPLVGTLTPLQGESVGWRFLFSSRDGGKVLSGWAESEAGRRIELAALMGQAPGPALAQAGLHLPVGYVLYGDGQALAALSLFGTGQGAGLDEPAGRTRPAPGRCRTAQRAAAARGCVITPRLHLSHRSMKFTLPSGRPWQ